MNLVRDLNDEQAQAVSHSEGPLLVIAGPGTGKTRVITYRIFQLIREREIPPEQILAITFTNKAAQEMRNRVGRLLRATGFNVWIDTFHAACTRILREHGDWDQLNRHFAILDQPLQEEILTECLRESGLHPRDVPVWSVRDWISYHKAKLSTIEQASEGEEDVPEKQQMLRQVASLYEQKLRQYEALDFDDLITRTVRLFQNSEQARSHYHDQIRYLLVDEYQDINDAQYELVKQLINPERNVMVVADADQAIYSWRGSDPSFIDRFRDDFSPEVIHLGNHYRSTQNILRTARSLITQNRPETEHKLDTSNEPGTDIYHYRMESADEESRTVIRLIQQLVEQRRYSYGDIAVFYRTHRLADKLEESLTQQQVAVQRVLPSNSFQRERLREIIACLRYFCWQLDHDLQQILNYPRQRIDSLNLVRLRAAARRQGTRLSEFIGSGVSAQVGPVTQRELKALFEQLQDHIIPRGSEQEAPSAMKAARALMEFLEQERSVFTSVPDTPQIAGLRFAADGLYRAIQLGETIHITSTETLECVLATTLLEQVLCDCLNVAPEIHWVPSEEDLDTPLPDGTHILVGNYPALDTDTLIIRLSHEQQQAEEHICLSADNLVFVGLRLGQRLLHYFEATRFDGCTVCAFRFRGQNPANAELIEVAATKLDAAGRGIEHYHTRVRPRSGVPEDWTAEEARRAPSIGSVLPDFVQFVEGQILVGHGIAGFAIPVLERELRKVGEHLIREVYDTREVAQRLSPRENCSLEAMASRLGIKYDTPEDPLASVAVSQKILLHVVRADQEKHQLMTLEEMLPLVALASETSDSGYYQPAVRSAKRREFSLEPLLSRLAESDADTLSDRWERLHTTQVETTPQDESWQELKSEFLNRVLQFEQLNPDERLEAFLDYQSLITSGDEVKDRDKVTLMTLHSAKGTEFPVVIIIGMEEGTFPLYSGDEALVQEERRLCYVGMTRAKERLYLFSVKRREGDQARRTSRFIREVPQSYIRYWSPEG